MRCYFATKANDLDIDSMECAATEIIADFPLHSIDVEHLTLDLSQPVDN